MLEWFDELEGEGHEEGKRGTSGAVDAQTEGAPEDPPAPDVEDAPPGTGAGQGGEEEASELTPEAPPPPVEKKPKRRRKRKKKEPEAGEAVRFLVEHSAEILGGVLADAEDVFLRLRGYPGLTDPERVRIVSAVRIVLERRGPDWFSEYGDLVMLAASLVMPVVVRARGMVNDV